LAIDVGAEAINRSNYTTSGFTRLALDNLANADGSLDTIEIWASSNMSGTKVGTLYLVSGTTYECRDSETIGDVTAGSKQSFTGLDCDVVTNDVVAAYWSGGYMERDSSGYAGVRYVSGDQLTIDNQADYSALMADDAMSLYGTGTAGGGATEKTGSDTGAGADAKASGSPLAAINGSETGSGADSLPSRDITLPESGSGVDALVSLQTPAAKTASDTGYGVEGTPLSGATLAAVDTGAGVDALVSLQMPAAKTSSDAGSGVEAVPVYSAVLVGSESGSGVEAFIARLLAAAEAGCGAEASEIGGGGLLKHLFASELGEGADGLTAKIEIPTKGGGMRLWT